MMFRRSCTWNLKLSSKLINFEVESSTGILHVKYDRLRVDWLEHEIHDEISMSPL